jgi:hypothetical protein
MLTSLRVSNLTVLPEYTFTFGKHLNVLVGENGSGKSHVMKAAYSLLATLAEGKNASLSDVPTKNYLRAAAARKLRGVFMPDELGRIASRHPGTTRCALECSFKENKQDISVSMHNRSKTEVTIDKLPEAWIKKSPVFLPTRELLTIYPGFTSLYKERLLPFEETWADTCDLLGRHLAWGPKETKIRKLLEALEPAMGGSVELDKSGRFYLRTASGRMEMHLVAEGLRKLAMLARLIATGSLLDKGYLFWDEPESNLNPRIIKRVARTILDLGENGIQVFLATHSLFLLRELHILQKRDYPKLDARFYGLHLQGNHVTIQGGSSIDEIGDISSLDEELSQADRYIDTEMGVPDSTVPTQARD